MNILLKCLKWNVSERIIITLETRPSESVQKNIIKSIKFYWNQTPSKKNPNILENGNGQIKFHREKVN